MFPFLFLLREHRNCLRADDVKITRKRHVGFSEGAVFLSVHYRTTVKHMLLLCNRLIAGTSTVRGLATAALPEVEAGRLIVLPVGNSVRPVAPRPDGIHLWRQGPHQWRGRKQQSYKSRHVMCRPRPGKGTSLIRLLPPLHLCLTCLLGQFMTIYASIYNMCIYNMCTP